MIKIPWTEEPGRLQSTGSRRVGHNWATSLSLFTFHFHALEKETAAHSSVLVWRIPGMGEPGGLPSIGSHRVGHDWSDLAAAAAASLPLLAELRKASSGLPLILHFGELYNYFIIYHNVIIKEIKCTMNVMFLNHPETTLSPPPLEKLSSTRSVPGAKKKGTTGLKTARGLR